MVATKPEHAVCRIRRHDQIDHDGPFLPSVPQMDSATGSAVPGRNLVRAWLCSSMMSKSCQKVLDQTIAGVSAPSRSPFGWVYRYAKQGRQYIFRLDSIRFFRAISMWAESSWIHLSVHLPVITSSGVAPFNVAASSNQFFNLGS